MCKYCSKTDNATMADIDTGWSYCEISIGQSSMVIDAGQYNEGAIFYVDIKFCPMCGRKLVRTNEPDGMEEE